MIIKFKRNQLSVYCATRGPGFGDAVLNAAINANGELIEIESADWHRLTLKHSIVSGPLGLGDAVAAVAQPIAGAIDVVLGTNIKGCGGCAQRREALNRAIPDISLGLWR